MKLSELPNNLRGDWVGTKLLRLSWLTPSDYVSSSHLTIAPVANGNFLTFTYTWSHENTAHEGLLLLGNNNPQAVVTAAWADSWHMSGKILSCEGAIDAQGTIAVRGFYEVPSHPDWGWRIIIPSSSDNNLQIVMYNCAPDGAEELAVQADYTRVR